MTGAPARYGPAQRALHWLTAALVVALIALALGSQAIGEARPAFAETLTQTHMSIGALVFAITLARIALRCVRPAPRLADATPEPWTAVAARAHAALYALLLVTTLAGYLKLAALGFEVRLFGVLSLPALAPDPPLAQAARAVHAVAAYALATLALGHAAVAVFHRALFGAPALHRML